VPHPDIQYNQLFNIICQPTCFKIQNKEQTFPLQHTITSKRLGDTQLHPNSNRNNFIKWMVAYLATKLTSSA
jgi:hypothetical protein